MNVHGRAQNFFDQHSIELGERFAVPAAISVQSAHVLAQATRVAARLQTVLTSNR